MENPRWASSPQSSVKATSRAATVTLHVAAPGGDLERRATAIAVTVPYRRCGMAFRLLRRALMNASGTRSWRCPLGDGMGP